MKVKINYILILILTILGLYSCEIDKRPRTIYWSGSGYSMSKIDSTYIQSFYLGYYIELSDTGDIRIMTRKDYQGEKLFYRIKLTSSTKDSIFSLIENKNIFLDSISNLKESEDVYIEERYPCYSGFIYNLNYKCDSINRIISYIPTIANPSQKKLRILMDSVMKNYMIIKETQIDLTQYESKLENEIRMKFPPPKIGEPILFTPSLYKNETPNR